MKIKTKPANEFYGADWGMGMLKYQACDACDDVYNETADIVLGDAWIEPYRIDWKGTNIVIIRNPIFDDLILGSQKDNNIVIEPINEENAIKTQLSSIRHRKGTIGYRLFIFNKKLSWIPKKRFAPTEDFNRKIKQIQELRLQITQKSHSAMQLAIKYKHFYIFKIIIGPYIVLYNYSRFGMRSLIPKRIKKLLKKIIKKNEDSYSKSTTEQ